MGLKAPNCLDFVSYAGESAEAVARLYAADHERYPPLGYAPARYASPFVLSKAIDVPTIIRWLSMGKSGAEVKHNIEVIRAVSRFQIPLGRNFVHIPSKPLLLRPQLSMSVPILGLMTTADGAVPVGLQPRKSLIFNRRRAGLHNRIIYETYKLYEPSVIGALTLEARGVLNTSERDLRVYDYLDGYMSSKEELRHVIQTVCEAIDILEATGFTPQRRYRRKPDERQQRLALGDDEW